MAPGKKDNKKKTIIVADDHPLFRAGVIAELQNLPDFEIVAEADNGKQVLELIAEHQPDLVVLDVMMPEMTGLEVARKLSEGDLQPNVILLTMYDEPSLFNEALESGVKGYVLKDATVQDICKAVRTVANGNYYFSADFSGALVKKAGLHHGPKPDTPAVEKLTTTELAILQLVAQVKSNEEIAGELFISKRTVENHKVNIARKLEVKGQNALLRYALQHKASL